METLFKSFLLLLAIAIGPDGSIIAVVYTSEKEVERIGCIKYLYDELSIMDFFVSHKSLDQKHMCQSVFSEYCLFKILLKNKKLSDFKNKTLSECSYSLMRLFKLKTYNQIGFVPKKNFEIWEKKERFFTPNSNSEMELESFVNKVLPFFYENCEKVIRIGLTKNSKASKKYRKYCNKLEKTYQVLQEYSYNYDPNKIEALFNVIIELFASCPIDFVSCTKDEFKVLIWLVVVKYATIAKKINHEELEKEEAEKILCYPNVLRNLICALFKYHVLLSDDPEKQIEKIKAFCNEIGMECQEDDDADDEENGLTPSTTPSTSPVPPTVTSSPSTTPPLQPAVQPAPTRPSPAASATRRAPPSTFTSELLRFFGW